MGVNSTIHDKLEKLTARPGVYIFKDGSNSVLYVGKAKNLKNRVSSYFKTSTNLASTRPWANVMVGLAQDFDTIIVENETEALLLEATLIKRHQPKFNIRLADDKSYPYIKYFDKEPIPRFTVTRSQTDDGATYFGPYLSTRTAYKTLEILRSVYGIHLSRKKLSPNQDRPCFNCQLLEQKCPLNNELSLDAYRENCHLAQKVLEGKKKRLLKDLKDQMNEASASSKFERAAKIRDYLASLTEVQQNQAVISTNLDNYDLLGLKRGAHLASITHGFVREGRLVHQNNFLLNILGDETDEEIISFFVLTLLASEDTVSRKLVLPCKLDATKLEEMFYLQNDYRISLIVSPKEDKRKLLKIINQNAGYNLEMKLLKSGDAYENLIDLQHILGLDFLPERIEAVDISNLGTSEAVGATVCFIGGKPAKDEYRRYKIKTVEGQNDFAMIREVVLRRLSDNSRPAPDVLMIDGGIEQLKFAKEAVDQAALQPKTLISLAKSPDRVFLVDSKKPLEIKRGSKGLRLLSQVRDEVHRFAITFQRSRQSKKSLSK